MAIYIDPDVVQDIDNINSSVFRYLIKKHKEYCHKLQKNYDGNSYGYIYAGVLWI